MRICDLSWQWAEVLLLTEKILLEYGLKHKCDLFESSVNISY